MMNFLTSKRISLISISMLFVLLIAFRCTDEGNSESFPDGNRKVEYEGDSLHFVGVETCVSCHATETEEWLNRSEEHTSELQSRGHLVCRLLLEKKKKEKIRR